MKQTLKALVIASFAFSPLAHADNGSEATPTEQAPTIPAEIPTLPPAQEVVSPQEPYGDLEEVWDEEEETAPEGTVVTTSSNETEKTRKRQFWTNIAIASVAVVIAVVSILVVSNNNGK
jgi:hypothetical protein